MKSSGYFDYNATTPVCMEAVEAFNNAVQHFGNPSSRHRLSSDAKAIIADARKALCELIGADPEELFFTSGGTEGNNWAIKGVFFQHLQEHGNSGHIVISSIEHASVLEACNFLKCTFGCQVTCVPPDSNGIVSADAISNAVRKDTFLVSVMLANNEVGTIQPIRQIAERLKDRNIHFHVDGVQAVGKIPVQVKELGIDSLSFAGHKFYAPKGVGGLFIRNGTRVTPLIHGGGQEQGARGGTESVALIAALGAAARIAVESMSHTIQYQQSIARMLRAELQKRFPTICFHGPAKSGQQVPNTISFCIPGIRAEALAALLDHRYGVQVSLGSACSNNKAARHSHVLLAMGLDHALITSTIRVSIGKHTSAEDISGFVSALASCVDQLQSIHSPAGFNHAVAAR
ncbi:MAG TPA: cysteine desulfurase family protein [Pseudohongiella sp.]|nr:cysteine desulfurase family protein [Pseudohongiella sp.]